MPESELSDLLRRVNYSFDTDEVTTEQKREAKELVDEVRADIEQLNSDDAFLNFIRRYLVREANKFQSHDRLEKLCSCEMAGCELKNGTVPRYVHEADNQFRAIREWPSRHTGDARVLEEAYQEFQEKEGRVKAKLQEALIVLNQEPERVDA
jgi:hypothetical protein